MEFCEKTTIGEKYGPALKITDQSEADEYFEALVEYTMRRWGKSKEEAEELERANLGYYAGYYSLETRLRVERLFGCEHPIFGPAANGEPSPKEAFEMGRQLMTKIIGMSFAYADGKWRSSSMLIER